MGVTERPVTMFREHVGQASGAMTGLVTEELTCEVAESLQAEKCPPCWRGFSRSGVRWTLWFASLSVEK